MADMQARLIACRIAVIRRALRDASSAAECLPALAAMVELSCEDGLDDAGAARARRLLDEAIGYLRAAAASLPANGAEHCAALYFLARACLRRDADGWLPDIDNAVACLRRVRTILPADDPDRATAETLLADALLTRGVKAPGRAADVTEAGQVLAAVLTALPPEHPDRRGVSAALALAVGVRFAGFGGTEADREAAEAYAAQALAGPGEPGDEAGTAHLVLAWTGLARQHTVQQRSAFLSELDIAAARSGAEAAARMRAAFGDVRIERADAEAAIAHLRLIPLDSAGPLLRRFVPVLWGIAQLSLTQAGAGVTDGGLAAAALGSLAANPETDETEAAELLALRAALLAGQSADGAGHALGDAASRLPPGHLLRTPLLGLLSPVLSGQVGKPAHADDLSRQLDEVAAILDRVPHDDPQAAHALTFLGMQILNASVSNRAVLKQDSLFAQVERLVSSLEPDDPLTPLAGFMIWAARYMRARLTFDAEGADAALGEIIRRADLVPDGHPARSFALASGAIAHIERHGINGELRNLDLARTYIDKAVATADKDGPLGPGAAISGYLLYLRGHLKAIRAVYNPSQEGAEDAITDISHAGERVGPAEFGRLGMVTSLGTAKLIRDLMTDRLGPGMPLDQETSDTFDQWLEAAEDAGRDSMDYPVLAEQAAAGLMLRGMVEHDRTLIDRSIALLADVCANPLLGLAERSRLLEAHGNALHIRYAQFGAEPRDLGNAIVVLQEAGRAVRQEEGNPLAARVLQSLAFAYRTRGNEARGDIDRAVETGLAGLRERAGHVLLQDSDVNALNMARQATNDAREMARWFLGRRRGGAAVSALELGRGMVLHAATSGAGVAAALAEAGYQDLASEWTARAAGPVTRRDGKPASVDSDEPPQDDDLRYRAIRALRGTPAAERLLSAPELADITAALNSSGIDALVYLLPQDDSGLGGAVLVDNAGNVRWLQLVRLRDGADTPVGTFLRTRRAMEKAADGLSARTWAAQAAFDSAVADWTEALEAVCDWAWPAAIGPVLQAVTALPGASLPPGSVRVPHIVLVPVGELGLVPWHAARRPAVSGQPSGKQEPHDYACRHAVFSYASSARQFIDAARRRVHPWSQAAVLISDADVSLTFALAEVAHLYDAHYSGGSVFGAARHSLGDRRIPGKDTAGPDDVLEALPHGMHPGSSVLHFGLHGRVRRPVLGSSLRLGTDPDDPEKEIAVSVSDILRQARTARAQADEGGLVVLASCVTDVTEADYDEALTLATAFLAAGSAGVVAAKWMVPDPQTALFMAAFHDFLNRGKRDPAHALREAQLWMLDPDRLLPGNWPKVLRDEAGMDGRPDGPNLTSAASWAGFTYQGR